MIFHKFLNVNEREVAANLQGLENERQKRVGEHEKRRSSGR
jgi:hypothetical protein